MPAYGFRKPFVEPILNDVKLHTIRPFRKNWKHGPRESTRGHARPGELLHLFTGMRTKDCKKIGQRYCRAVEGISMSWERSIVLIGDLALPVKKWRQLDNWQSTELDAFAVKDGFLNWKAMWDWFTETHGEEDFLGCLIHWHPSTWSGGEP